MFDKVLNRKLTYPAKTCCKFTLKMRSKKISFPDST